MTTLDLNTNKTLLLQWVLVLVPPLVIWMETQKRCNLKILSFLFVRAADCVTVLVNVGGRMVLYRVTVDAFLWALYGFTDEPLIWIVGLMIDALF